MKFDLTLRLRNFITNFYLAPISDKGLVAAWRGKRSNWRHGFVVRVLWLGFVVRWGYKKMVYLDYEGPEFVFDEATH